MAFVEPNLGLNYGWALGENNWNNDMDDNFKRLGALFCLSVKDRSLTDPPALPNIGDRYLVNTGSGGLWTGHDYEISLWDGSDWVFYTPKTGWLCYVENEDKLCMYKNTVWSSGISI